VLYLTEQVETRVYVAFINSTKQACQKEFEEYKRKFPPQAYATRIVNEGIDEGPLGDGYFITAVRQDSAS
jgi:hypothetical protein